MMFNSLKNQYLSRCESLDEEHKPIFEDLVDNGIIGRIQLKNQRIKDLYFIENAALSNYSEIETEITQIENKQIHPPTNFQQASSQITQADKDEYLKSLASQILELRKQKLNIDQRLNSDQVYIRRLHEYNYLKDAAFQLVETVALISEVTAKTIFEEFDVRDTETCFMK